MQKAGELELSLKCSMKTLSHLFSRKMKSSRGVFAVEHISTNHFLTASLLCFLSCFHSERKRESMSAIFFSLASKHEIV